MVADGEERQPQDLEPDDDRDPAMDPFDPRLRVIQWREDLVVTERPVRAAEPRIRGPHHDADRHEDERRHEGRQGQASVGRHEAVILSRRRRFPTRTGTLRVVSFLIRRRHLAALLILGTIAAACSSGGGAVAPSAAASATPAATASGSTGTARCETAPQPASNEGWDAPVGAQTIIPYVITSQAVCGDVRFLFSFLDPDNRPIAAPDRTATVAFYDLGRSLTEPVTTVDATFAWAIEGDRGIYIANATLPEAGTWGAEFTTEAPGSPKQTIRLGFDVLDDGSTVAVGEAAPASKTPTLADVGGDVTKISTDKDPDPAFYKTSVADAVSGKQPFILVFATPKFCQTAQCGPTLDKVKPIAAANPDVTFINVEPYQLKDVEGQLQPVVDAQNFPIPVDATNEWGLTSEPWIFAVDGSGIVRGSYMLLATDDGAGNGDRGDHGRELAARARPRGGSRGGSPDRPSTTPDRRRGRLVFGQMTGRELDAVLQCRELEPHDLPIRCPEGETADVTEARRVDLGDHPDDGLGARWTAGAAGPTQDERRTAADRQDEHDREREQIPGPSIHG